MPILWIQCLINTNTVQNPHETIVFAFLDTFFGFHGNHGNHLGLLEKWLLRNERLLSWVHKTYNLCESKS